MEEKKLSDYAVTLGYKEFKKRLREYRKSLKAVAQQSGAVMDEITQFDEQGAVINQELYTGEWQTSEAGIWKYGSMGGIEYACTHPIIPVERLKNIDTGELKVRLAFRRGNNNRRTWTEILTDFDTVSNAKNIVSLSRIGISVTSGKRAQNLVDYLTEVMDKNYDAIPERKSVSRLGWNEEGFSPYVDGVVFDGTDSFGRIFNAIKPRGEYDAWLEEARDARKYSVTARIVLAASFASALVGPLGCLPFFVHLWGMDSGTGKTVAQMLAASVWGNPAVGGPLFPTFKSTSVGVEVLAGFLNSLPVVIDELQLAKDNRGRINFNVYELASGSGKLRSNKTLGLASTPSWANCFITSGETPLVGENDGAGAANRVIEIECKANDKAIEDGHRTANALKANYGHAGKMFIERLVISEWMDAAKYAYELNFERCLKNDTTEKQAHAAALIITADALATEWLFMDGRALTVAEVSEFLKSKASVSAADRGYEYMLDWVSRNANKLKGYDDKGGDVWGMVGVSGDELGWVYINRSVFKEACTEASISAPALLSHLRTRGLIQTRGRAMTKNKRLNGVNTECVVLKLREDAADIDTSCSPFE
ncbi:MAG: DUF927 domain-containing protein [Eubacteriales bacterium]